MTTPSASAPPGQEVGLLQNLVTQFSSALDCLRELVQNAIDAGSPSVDVWMEFERSEHEHTGVISIHVDDYGEGMDEAIIDNQLTQLFSSSKENDLTKIGKFGIGFVSVFALNPRGVLVQTGRGGQFWEVFFHADRTFTKVPVETPCEGTQITLFLEGDYRRYRELVSGVRDTLKRWCAHADHEIGFEDRSPPGLDVWPEREIINDPFDLPGVCKCLITHQGTEIVLAYNHKPLYGFYNRGLTLAMDTVGENVLDKRAGRYRHITFKMKSRYLEHTLSRETVMRDANYEKAMRLVDDAINGPLLEQLVTELEALCSAPQWGHEQVVAYLHLLSFLLVEPLESLLQLSHRRILRSLDGQALSLERLLEIFQLHGRILLSEHRTPLIDQLIAQQHPVLFGSAPQALASAEYGLWSPARLFVRYGAHQLKVSTKGKAKRLWGWVSNATVNFEPTIIEGLADPERVYLPVTIHERPAPAVAALIAHAQQLLEGVGLSYRRVTTCTIASPTHDIPMFVIEARLSPLMARPAPQLKAPRHVEVAVNIEHHHIGMLLQMAQTEPAMAAYCLAKGLLLAQDRDLDLDLKLMSLAANQPAP